VASTIHWQSVSGLCLTFFAASFLAYPFSMRCVLGFDGGGTKTECVLMDEAQHILARGRSGPSNPLRIGLPVAVASLEEAALRTLREAGVERRSLAALCAGLAGAAQPEIADRVAATLASLFPAIPVKVCTDLDTSLAATGDGPAVVLIAGTGSATIGRDAIGRIARAGGNGPLLGDEGSAYDIGRRAILVALRDLDRTGDDSPLGKQVLRQLGCTAWPEVQQRVSTAAGEIFPRAFPVVAVAADAGDKTARMLLTDAARDLASLAKIVVVRLDLGRVDFLLAKTGGTLGRSAFFDAKLDEFLRELAPKARIGPLPMPPVEAAAHLALRLISAAESAGK
jgi:N-acetylglucosamine kinase-like BadF-type ATPase